MPKRICKTAFQYKLRPVGVGDELDVDQRDLPIALAAGWIEPMEGEPGFSAPAHVERARRARAKSA